MEPLKRAIEIAGSTTMLAKQIGVSRQAVEKWEQNGVPADRALDIERVVGGAVKRHELRPELYEGYVLGEKVA